MLQRDIEQYFFFGLLALSAILMFFVWKPFLSPIVLAIAFAIIFKPLHGRIFAAVGGRPNWAAFLTTCVALLIVVLLLIFFGGLLISEARGIYLQGTSGAGGFIETVTHTLETYVQKISPAVKIDVSLYIERSLNWLIGHLDSIFSGFFKILMSLFLMGIAFFYILRDGEVLKRRLVILSPLANSQDESILRKLEVAVGSVIRGSLLIAIIQGILSSIGFFIFGMPNPVVFGVITMFASLIPGIGTALVFIPSIGYLLYSGMPLSAIGLAIWGALAVGLIDNFLSPILIKRGVGIHPFLILISVLGGLAFFGPVGFLLGPILLSFFFALLEMYMPSKPLTLG